MMSYEVVLQNKYYLGGLIESISLTDSLDMISYQGTFNMKIPADFPGIEPGQEIRVSGTPFGGSSKAYLLHPGVVWECSSSVDQSKHMRVSFYDRTIYLARSEDECLFSAGGTATQRLKKYAADWNIKLALSIPDTNKRLKKAVYRAQTIYNMIMSDLKETVKAGGDMYIPRMTPSGLGLFKIGSNETVWVLGGIESSTQNRTLEETVTKVKVLGTADGKEDAPSKVLAIATGETAKYGVLQRIVQDDDVKSAEAAKKLAQSKLTGIGETYTVQCIDLNTIRAGDRVSWGGQQLIVTGVTHELGNPGHMTLDLTTLADVKRRYFLDS